MAYSALRVSEGEVPLDAVEGAADALVREHCVEQVVALDRQAAPLARHEKLVAGLRHLQCRRPPKARQS